MPNPPAETGAGHAVSRVLLRVASLVWWLVLAVLVLLALYAGIGRQLTQNIDSHRQELEQILSQELGMTVTIDRIQASWQWLDPVLQAQGLRVHHQDEPERAIGELQHLRIRLDSLSSLLRWRIVFEEFVADGLDVTLTRTDAGAIRAGGVAVAEPALGGDWFDRLGRLLSDPYVRLTRVNLGLKVPGEATQHVDIPQLDLIYERGVFTATGRAMQSGTTEQIASFSLQGRHFFRGDFDGTLYLDLDSGRLFDGFVRGLSWQGLALQGFDLKGQGWLTFSKGELVQGNGRLRLPYLLLATDRQTLAPIENLTTRVGWRRLPGQADTVGEIHLRDLRWRWNGTAVAPIDLRLDRHGDHDELVADGLSIRPLWRLADALGVLPPAASGALNAYRPGGRLDRARLSLPRANPAGFQFSAALRNLDVAAYGGAPGASGLSGQLWLDADSGWVDVDARDVTLGFPELFLAPWTLDRLDTRVSWVLEDGINRVFSDRVRMDYQGDTRISGGFDLSMEQGGEDILGLRVRLENGDAGMLADFVPARIVSDELYRWLTTAVESARIPEGVFYGHGEIGSEAPDNSFSTSMQYRFEEAVVRYDPAWPEVTGAAGTVTVQDGTADITLDQGQTEGITLDGSRIGVTEGPVVTVDTETALTGAQAQQWLAQTPLQADLGAIGGAIELAGDYGLALDLALPLAADGGEISVDAQVATDSGTVTYREADLVWRDLAGELRYRSSEGFSAEPLTATFLGQPVSVRLARSGDNGRLAVIQRGRLTVADLLDRFDPALLGDPGVGGAFNYQARLELAGDEATLLALESSLQGVTVEWPAPLAKAADTSAPLKLWAEWQGNEVLVSGNWEERLATRLRWRAGAFSQGELALGSSSAALPEDAGMRIVGDLALLDVSAWQQRLESTLGGSGALGDGVSPDWLSLVDLKADALVVAGESFEAIRVAARPGAGQWDLSLDSDQVAGEVILPLADAEPVIVRLETLKLDAADRGEDARDNLHRNRFETWQVAQWPPVDVAIDSLHHGDSILGAWSFRLEPSADALTVSALKGRLSDLAFDGELVWQAAGVEETRLDGRLSGGSLEGLSSVFDGEVPFRNDSSEMIVDLAWPGSPDQISATTINGSVSMRFDDGVILESNNTAQLFRVFNLLNSDTLWRRLKLDFSDLYEAGVSFDAISGKAVLSGGMLRWDPELQIVGPSGAFKLSGITDLREETLDMRLVVVLPLTQNLPLAALLMGASAPIGGALFVLDKVLGDPLSKLTSATYSVQGTWDQPEVRLRNVFDTGQ